MSEKKKKLRGFAKVISQQLEPLNGNEEFKNKFKDTDLKILLNAVDGRYAALIKIKEGTVDVDGIKNDEKENLTKEALGWDGRLATTTNLFFKIATGELSTLSMIGKIITRKIKIKGISKVLALTDIFELL
ncbi:MAG: hypothetical protein GF311_04675 [Candidatus Lokiarchaeota archaeon]|nr:hypothetical protein [Candidatus Lokiarchaeota archaeon]